MFGVADGMGGFPRPSFDRVEEDRHVAIVISYRITRSVYSRIAIVQMN
jgi:hypothetical protein